MQKSMKLRRVIQTALLIAICLVLRNIGYMFYFGGGAGLRISMATFVSKLPALLFGPLYGAIADSVVDILAYIQKPDGAYMPLLTLTAALGGIMTGFMWKYAKNINSTLFSKIFVCIFSILGILGITNMVVSSFFPESNYGAWLINFGKKLSFLTVWPLISALLAFLIFALDTILRKKANFPDNFMKLFSVLLVSNIIITTLNTFLLMIFIPSLGKLGFIAFYIPRFIEECIATMLQAYASSYLLKAYEKLYSKNQTERTLQ